MRDTAAHEWGAQDEEFGWAPHPNAVVRVRNESDHYPALTVVLRSRVGYLPFLFELRVVGNKVNDR